MLTTLLFSILALFSSITIAEQFQPAITDTQWTLIDSPIECTLTQPIRDFGQAQFSQQAGGRFALTFSTHLQPAKQGHVTFEIAEAPWQNSEQRQDLTVLKTQQGQTRFQIRDVLAKQALNHINEGRFPTIFYHSQHSQQNISVLMSTIHLQDYLPQFETCLSQLLPYSFDDIKKLTVNFELAKAELGDQERAALLRLARFVSADNTIRRIRITGHTDSHGKRQLNQTLSDARITVVKQFLLDHGVDESLIVAESLLARVPVMTNKNQKGRAYNRRAEIEVFR